MQLFKRQRKQADDIDALLVFSADWHVNDTVGLRPLTFLRAGGSEDHAGPAQRELWYAWVKCWQYVARRKEELGVPVYHFAVGDLGDLNKHSGAQLVSPRNQPAILQAMADVYDIPAPTVDYTFILRGTEAHTGRLNELEESFGRDIAAERHPDSGDYSWYWFDHDIAGVRIFAAHHPPTASRHADKQDIAVGRSCAIVQNRRLKYRQYGRIPDVCVFAHHHYAAFGHCNGTYGYQLPPFKWVGAFGERIGTTGHVEPVGLLVLEVQNGRITNHGKDAFEVHHPKEGTPWQPTK